MMPSHVPATAPTVTITWSYGSIPDVAAAFEMHATDVPELHVAVAHTAASNTNDDVKFWAPKLRPVTVTDDMPDLAAFGCG